MALKKGVFENYVKDRVSSTDDHADKRTQRPYTHNRVFDEPESLKKIMAEKPDDFAMELGGASDKPQNKVAVLPSTGVMAPTELQAAQISPVRVKQKIIPSFDQLHTETPTSKEKTTESKHHPNPPALISSKNSAGYLWTFSRLKGNERSILLYIYDMCRAIGSKESGPVYINHLCDACSISCNTAHRSIVRLIKKEVLMRETFMPGRGGYTIYRLPDVVYDEIFSLERIGKLRESFLPHGALRQNYNNRDISMAHHTAQHIDNNVLPESWSAINTKPLDRINFGISEIRNIFRKRKSDITPEQIQDSVYQFAFGMKNNPDRYKNMKSKVAVLVSQLIEGTPWKEEEYISPEELLRREKEKKLQEFIDSFNQPKFSEWFAALSEEEREEITPDAIKQQLSYEIPGVKLQLQKEQAKLYFDRHIWPGIEKEFRKLS